MRVGWRNRDKSLVEGELGTLGIARHEQREQQGDSRPEDSATGPGGPAPEHQVPLEADTTAEAEAARERVPPGDYESEPVRGQLERLNTQIHGLQEQIGTFIARRNEAVAERASRQVASIVAAAEQSAAEIKASAERDAAEIRARLIAEAQAEVERIRSEAHADAARIRTEAHAETARARERAIAQASDEIQAVCERLAGELQAAARTAISEIGAGAHEGAAAPLAEPTPAVRIQSPGVQAEGIQDEGMQGGAGSPSERSKAITQEIEEAVDELQTAATVLEQSLSHLRTIGEEPQRTD